MKNVYAKQTSSVTSYKPYRFGADKFEPEAVWQESEVSGVREGWLCRFIRQRPPV